jgi:RNA polymerase sigma-70 factor (ECF subfamily)
MLQGKRKQQAYEQCVLAYSDDLYRYAIWLSKDVSMAEDLVQECCLRAWKSLDKLREATSSKAWLITILRNEFNRQFARYRPDMVELELDQVAGKDLENDASTEAFVLRQALAELADEYREPLVLQVIGGFSCDEIAGICGISKSAAMTRLFRAKQKMREVLQPNDDLAGEAT